MMQRANVLRVYRELVDLIKRLPAERREFSLQEARASMRANIGEADPLKASEMLKDLVARVSFLRMATPKTYRDRCGPYVWSVPFVSDSLNISLIQFNFLACESPCEFHAGGQDMALRHTF
jgi:hypothetical protein